jgi:hypothetical protein
MVPVPEEHVREVMEFVVRTIARSSIEDWDAASLEELWHGTDEAGRSLLSVVARGVLTGKEVTDEAAASFVQLSARENAGVIRELNDAARTMNRPGVVSATMVNESLPNGRLREKRVLVMTPDVAGFVRDLARAERTHSAG